ncbi:hypothetical protein GC176_20930 [bacterium]|nr:hypothetical protein [bacterium]
MLFETARMDQNAAPESEPASQAEPLVARDSVLPGTLPEELPPVEPPSAGFIMQLFLVPAIIVAAVIGIWALFGQLSASEQDWRQLVAELRSNNEHRRWRGANGLAQMLRADLELGGKGQNLAANQQIAKEMTDLMSELLSDPARSEEQIRQQSFIATTLGWLDVYDTTLPVLISATQPDQDLIVRADALRALSIMAARASERGEPINREDVIDCLSAASQDREPLIRQVAAFAMGFLSGDIVEQRLQVLLEDGDSATRLNAAIALARNQNADGIDVFLSTLESAPQSVDPEKMEGETPQERLLRARSEDDMNTIVVGNVLKAVRELKAQLSDEQKAKALKLAQSIADNHREVRIRLEAETTIRELSAE